ncbi:hypothetical protein E0Z10_g5592 [Xylaria hypoxylon]|uniref:Uncharacterized protein n=1 Tax=Xylaria hypoxylon TaxID=37992 RepID=A0A4Z0YI97_9PEZI|nr:hypothetical protein E0Z10_g5592 [Xylaria hypoxylon]
MKFATALAFMAGAVTAGAHDVSYLPNGIYKIPIKDTGIIDYDNAINLNITYFMQSESSFNGFLNSGDLVDDMEEAIKDPEYGNDDDEIHTGSLIDLPLSPSHCHWHYPHHQNRFITGHTLMNMTNYPLTLAMFMDWMTTGADGGWLNRGEVRMAKANDIVVGACVFKKPRLQTCVHELSLAMGAADRECAAGKVGCHVCLRAWHKDYFRFATSEAPNQCECAWYYY